MTAKLTVISDFHFCEIEPMCIHPAKLRLCGHMACDHHTDYTDLCGWCVPIEPRRAEALAEQLRRPL